MIYSGTHNKTTTWAIGDKVIITRLDDENKPQEKKAKANLP